MLRVLALLLLLTPCATGCNNRSAPLLVQVSADAPPPALPEPSTTNPVTAVAWLTPRRRFRDGDWAVALAWGGSFPTTAALPETVVGALGRRLGEVAHTVRRGPAPSVALPSRTDGSIEAEELSARFDRLGRRDAPPELEAAIALLRVDPAHRPAVRLPPAWRGSRLLSRVLSRVLSLSVHHSVCLLIVCTCWSDMR